jgi:hypothetical protein
MITEVIGMTAFGRLKARAEAGSPRPLGPPGLKTKELGVAFSSVQNVNGTHDGPSITFGTSLLRYCISTQASAG